jgi:hypothetical protein
MQLSDMIFATVGRIFHPAINPRLQGKERMIIPSLRDLSSSRHSAKVEKQCREAAKLLAGHLYIWRKPFPEKSTVKIWNTESLSFVGMNIEDFQNFLIEHFVLVTDDNRQWLLDRNIAAMIWNSCTEEASPLLEASWQEERNRKRKAARS